MADQSLRIVYVNNHTDLGEVIEMALTRLGKMKAVGYDDAQTALDAIIAEPPDAVFVDAANVQGMASFFLKELRAVEHCAAVPVLLASDRKRSYQIRRYIALGATKVIPTPINPFGLAEAIRSLVAAAERRRVPRKAAAPGVDPVETTNLPERRRVPRKAAAPGLDPVEATRIADRIRASFAPPAPSPAATTDQSRR